jgi:asparagine synthase (glutamine-hydrolysing)
MCGIAGVWSATSPREELLVQWADEMADALAHRGPDDRGIWCDAAAGIALGHRRLSIIDLSQAGHQPMVCRSGRYHLVYNGEVYNSPGLRAELLRDGAQFNGHSDTEVVLAAIALWGVERTVGRLVGMFAFALWDRAERTLHLCRDRFGEKPLYYASVGGDLVFASELKALVRHPQWSGRIDRDALALYLQHGYVPDPFCIYEGAAKVRPGTLLTFRSPHPDSARTFEYWSLREAVQRGAEHPFRGSETDASLEVERLLSESVRQQLLADVPVGAFLSGGVDSSAVVALMQRYGSSTARTFSVGFDDPQFNEAPHARAVARHLGTDHEEMYVGAADVQAVIPGLPGIYDEPFADTSQLPTLLVARLARQQVSVALGGDGGDELFGGYDRYRRVQRLWAAVGSVPRPVRRPLGTAASGLADWLDNLPNRYLPAARRWAHWCRSASHVLRADNGLDIHGRLVSNWWRMAPPVLGGRPHYTLLTHLHTDVPALGLIEQMMYLDTMSYLPGALLTKVDRATMSIGLETRLPFLDHHLVEFAWSLPVGMKVSDGRTKRVLRRMLHRHVPASLIERPKMGFGVPIGTWLRGPLRAWADDLLAPEGLAADALLDVDAVRREWMSHASGTHDRTWSVWALLMFRAWHAEQGMARPSASKRILLEAS